jgi:DNA-binding transcriptional regulator YdaS (Cro superfamily)
MTYAHLIAHYGTQKAAADALGIKGASVSEWKDKGIPLPRQAQYELLTGGVLTAERPEPTDRHAPESAAA